MSKGGTRFTDAKCDRCGKVTGRKIMGYADLFVLEYPLPLKDQGAFCQTCIDRYSEADWLQWFHEHRPEVFQPMTTVPTFATLEDSFAWLNSLPAEITPRVVRMIAPNGKIDYCWKISAIVYKNEKFDHEIEHSCVNLLAGLNTFAVMLTLEKEAGLI